MVPRGLLLGCGLTLSSLAGLLPFTASPSSARPTPEIGSTTELEWQFLEAETAVSLREFHIAESHYREAMRESWFLLGLLDSAAGDLPTASAALERARNAAATGLEPARSALASVQLRLGEVEQPLRELRFVVYENPSNVEAAKRFVLALAAAGQTEELAAELQRLGTLDEAAAQAIRRRLTASEATTLQPPPVELGLLTQATEEERSQLRQKARASLARAQWNLAMVQAWADGREPSAQVAEPAAEDGALGMSTLTQDDRPPSVGPFRITPVPWMSKFPSSLLGSIMQLDEGNVDDAIDMLRSRIAAGDQDQVEARTLLGISLAIAGSMAEAERELSRAATDSAEAAQNLGRLLWLTDRREAAADALRLAARQGPIERDLAMALAGEERAAQQPLQAAELLRSVARRFDSAAATLQLAELARDDGRTKQALENVERALRLAPSSEQILRLHTELALETEITNAAARSAEPLVRMYPEVAEYQFMMGETWRQRHKIGEASESFLEAVEIDPDFSRAFLPLALTLNHESRFAEARGFLERWLADHPNDLDALAALAEAEQRLGSPEAAEARVRAVLVQAPQHARANLALGMVHSERQEFAAARPLLQTAVDADPSLAKAHYQLSFACARLRDRDCASRHLELYKKALEGPEANLQVLEAETSEPRMMQQMKQQEGGSQ